MFWYMYTWKDVTPFTDTWSSFETRCLLALQLKLYPTSKQGRHLFEGGVYLRIYSIAPLVILFSPSNIRVVKQATNCSICFHSKHSLNLALTSIQRWVASPATHCWLAVLHCKVDCSETNTLKVWHLLAMITICRQRISFNQLTCDRISCQS